MSSKKAIKRCNAALREGHIPDRTVRIEKLQRRSGDGLAVYIGDSEMSRTCDNCCHGDAELSGSAAHNSCRCVEELLALPCWCHQTWREWVRAGLALSTVTEWYVQGRTGTWYVGPSGLAAVARDPEMAGVS